MGRIAYRTSTCHCDALMHRISAFVSVAVRVFSSRPRGPWTWRQPPLSLWAVARLGRREGLLRLLAARGHHRVAQGHPGGNGDAGEGPRYHHSTLTSLTFGVQRRAEGLRIPSTRLPPLTFLLFSLPPPGVNSFLVYLAYKDIFQLTDSQVWLLTYSSSIFFFFGRFRFNRSENVASIYRQTDNQVLCSMFCTQTVCLGDCSCSWLTPG